MSLQQSQPSRKSEQPNKVDTESFGKYGRTCVVGKFLHKQKEKSR